MTIRSLSIITLIFIATACGKKESGDPTTCKDQSMDFQSCLSCCQENGFTGASLPTDANGNYLECECQN
jgi:hypothetical protein